MGNPSVRSSLTEQQGRVAVKAPLSERGGVLQV